MNTYDIRPELTDLPDRMQGLPVDKRGYPVPYFVLWIDGEPEFRAMNPARWMQCVSHRLCWVCGQRLGKFLAFLIGPMCAVNRTTSEPACHLECARWSAKNCPFLSRPHMHRRVDERVANAHAIGGEMIRRNPGVSLIWVTLYCKLFNDGKGQPLIEVGDPQSVEWWSEGRRATRGEVSSSIASGLPILEEIARTEQGAIEDLYKRLREIEPLLPAA